MKKIRTNEDGAIILILALLIPTYLFIYGVSMDLININLNTQKLIQITDASTLASAVHHETIEIQGTVFCRITEEGYQSGYDLFEKNKKVLNNVTEYKLIYNQNKIVNIGDVYMKESDVGIVSAMAYVKMSVYFINYFTNEFEDTEFIIYSESASECKI